VRGGQSVEMLRLKLPKETIANGLRGMASFDACPFEPVPHEILAEGGDSSLSSVLALFSLFFSSPCNDDALPYFCLFPLL